MISTNDLIEFKINATDGDAGSCKDLLFHSTDWTVRHLVVESGRWLFGRRVLIEPDSVAEAEVVGRALHLNISKDAVKNSVGSSNDPALDEGDPEPFAPPVPEDLAHRHDITTTGNVAPDPFLAGGAIITPEPYVAARSPRRDHYLYALSEVMDYKVMCGEDEVGRIAGFLVDPVAWDLPLAIVTTQAAEGGVLLPTRLIRELSLDDKKARTDLQAAVLNQAPAYDPRIMDENVFMPVVADYYSSRV